MIKLCIRAILLISYGLLYSSARVIAEYDQKQNGKVNVQVDIKDIQIIAVVNYDFLEDYVNYDYAYDDSDFTIKPTEKPVTTTTGIITSIPQAITESTESSVNVITEMAECIKSISNIDKTLSYNVSSEYNFMNAT